MSNEQNPFEWLFSAENLKEITFTDGSKGYTLEDGAVEEMNRRFFPSVDKRKKGCVYLIKGKRIKEPDIYKIGLSEDVDKRIKQIRHSCLMEIEFVSKSSVSKECEALESYLHEMFEHKKFKGEWFLLSASDVKLVCLILENN